MFLLRTFGGLALAVALTGCVLSIDAVIPEAGAIFDPRLLGLWEDSSNSVRAMVSRGPDSTYRIEYRDDDDTARFEARLGRLGEHVVLDVWPLRPENESGLMIPGHLVLKLLDIGTDEMRLAGLEPDSVIAAIRAGEDRLVYTRSDNQVVLHGATAEVHAALARLAARPGAFGTPGVWRRTSAAADTIASGPIRIPCFDAAAWPEANRLFQRDAHWVGGDGSATVDLGNGRILWLFGDSWIDPSGRHTRNGARMVSNSVAIQTGTDPSAAAIAFYWGRARDGSPAPFIPDAGEERHWFGRGVRVDDRLVLFLNRVRSPNTSLGFESVGWTAWLVENPDAEPSAWRMRELQTPTNPLGVLVGFAAVLRLGEFVFAFGSEDPVKSHPIYAVRWPAAAVREGRLMYPEWWAGDRLGWIPDSSRAPRRPIFEDGQSGLSVHLDSATRQVLAVQTQGFGPADIMLRAAPALAGPWSAPRMIHRPSEYYRPNIMIYSAQAHPELTGADLVVTYDTNTFQFAEHASDPLIYYPRFLRLARCR